jgi:hypothetical protein
MKTQLSYTETGVQVANGENRDEYLLGIRHMMLHALYHFG